MSERTVSSVAKALLLDGLDNDAVFAQLQAEFGLPLERRGYPAWYRSRLTKEGLLPEHLQSRHPERRPLHQRPLRGAARAMQVLMHDVAALGAELITLPGEGDNPPFSVPAWVLVELKKPWHPPPAASDGRRAGRQKKKRA